MLSLQTTQTSIRLEDQTFSTKVRVTVTPHTMWVQSDESLSVTSVFSVGKVFCAIYAIAQSIGV